MTIIESTDLYILSGCALLLIIAISVTFAVRKSTIVATNYLLKQQAKHDYRQARGTVHRELLWQAQERLLRSKEAIDSKLTDQRNERALLISARDRRLHVALSRHLVRTRLHEVNGIGAQRRAAILRDVFRGELSDLRLARSLPGIGPQIQLQIDKWIRHYEMSLPQRLAEDFPGKREIEDEYARRIRIHDEQISRLEKELARHKELLSRIIIELGWLQQVNEKTFWAAMQKPKNNTALVNDFLKGVFGEWEQAPEWFTVVTDTNS